MSRRAAIGSRVQASRPTRGQDYRPTVPGVVQYSPKKRLRRPSHSYTLRIRRKGPGKAIWTAPWRGQFDRGRRRGRRWADPARARHPGVRTSVVEVCRCQGRSHQRVVLHVGDALLPSAQCAGGSARGAGRRPDAGKAVAAAARQSAEGAGRATPWLRGDLTLSPLLPVVSRCWLQWAR